MIEGYGTYRHGRRDQCRTVKRVSVHETGTSTTERGSPSNARVPPIVDKHASKQG